jgi:hypothetical protein
MKNGVRLEGDQGRRPVLRMDFQSYSAQRAAKPRRLHVFLKERIQTDSNPYNISGGNGVGLRCHQSRPEEKEDFSLLTNFLVLPPVRVRYNVFISRR